MIKDQAYKAELKEITETTYKDGKCKWFMHCDNPAIARRSHPILGAVPICKRCKARIERIDKETEHANK